MGQGMGRGMEGRGDERKGYFRPRHEDIFMGNCGTPRATDFLFVFIKYFI